MAILAAILREYGFSAKDSVVRRHQDIFEEIRFRAALAVTQWEALQENAHTFRNCIQQAREHLARVNEAMLRARQSTAVDASSSEASQALQLAWPYRDTRP